MRTQRAAELQILSRAAVGELCVTPRGDWLQLCVVLFKLRIGVFVTLSALAGALVVNGGWLGPAETGFLALAVMLASAGASAINHWFERDLDRLMARTRQRPFASGRLQPTLAWPSLFMAMIVAGSLLAMHRFGLASGAFVAAGAVTYALVYTVWLKRRSDWNIVVGGAAGSWAVLAGAAAAGQVLTAPVLLLAAVLFLWTPSHFWSLAVAMSDQYRDAGVPMLPVTRGPVVAARWHLVNTILLVVCTVAFAAVVDATALWLGALSGCGWLLWTSVGMVREPDGEKPMIAFRASLLQLGLLFLGLFLAYAGY